MYNITSSPSLGLMKCNCRNSNNRQDRSNNTTNNPVRNRWALFFVVSVLIKRTSLLRVNLVLMQPGVIAVVGPANPCRSVGVVGSILCTAASAVLSVLLPLLLSNVG